MEDLYFRLSQPQRNVIRQFKNDTLEPKLTNATFLVSIMKPTINSKSTRIVNMKRKNHRNGNNCHYENVNEKYNVILKRKLN